MWGKATCETDKCARHSQTEGSGVLATRDDTERCAACWTGSSRNIDPGGSLYGARDTGLDFRRFVLRSHNSFIFLFTPAVPPRPGVSPIQPRSPDGSARRARDRTGHTMGHTRHSTHGYAIYGYI